MTRIYPSPDLPVTDLLVSGSLNVISSLSLIIFPSSIYDATVNADSDGTEFDGLYINPLPPLPPPIITLSSSDLVLILISDVPPLIPV